MSKAYKERSRYNHSSGDKWHGQDKYFVGLQQHRRAGMAQVLELFWRCTTVLFGSVGPNDAGEREQSLTWAVIDVGSVTTMCPHGFQCLGDAAAPWIAGGGWVPASPSSPGKGQSEKKGLFFSSWLYEVTSTCVQRARTMSGRYLNRSLSVSTWKESLLALFSHSSPILPLPSSKHTKS